MHRLEHVITCNLSELPSIPHISPTALGRRRQSQVTLTERDRGGEPGEPGASVPSFGDDSSIAMLTNET